MGQQFLGEIRVISWNFPPDGWAFCNGALLPINQYQALFSILGTTYGGNGQVNFALPNLQGRVPVHVGDGITLGESGGETTHTLSIPEMPAHAHIPVGSASLANRVSAVGNLWGAAASDPYSNVVSGVMNPAAVLAVGGGLPHENMSPYLVLNFIIALQGIFPAQN